jgi:hypothetical protein
MWSQIWQLGKEEELLIQCPPPPLKSMGMSVEQFPKMETDNRQFSGRFSNTYNQNSVKIK